MNYSKDHSHSLKNGLSKLSKCREPYPLKVLMNLRAKHIFNWRSANYDRILSHFTNTE